MKLNISNPATGAQKLYDFEEEKNFRHFFETRMAQEVPLDPLGDEWAGYRAIVTGGNDKQGFPMKQGVLTPQRVRLLLSKGHSCYRERRDGERKRKSVRGSIVSNEIGVLALKISKQGEAEIPGLTDTVIPNRLGPKRATKIRRFFNLNKGEERAYVIRREITRKSGKTYTKAPAIQRLVTPQRLQRRRHLRSIKKRKTESQKESVAEYKAKLAQHATEKKAHNASVKAAKKSKRSA